MDPETEQTIDLQDIHGSTVVRQILALFDQGSGPCLIKCPQKYQLRFNGQTREELFRQALEIQSYTAGIPTSPKG